MLIPVPSVYGAQSLNKTLFFIIMYPLFWALLPWLSCPRPKQWPGSGRNVLQGKSQSGILTLRHPGWLGQWLHWSLKTFCFNSQTSSCTDTGHWLVPSLQTGHWNSLPAFMFHDIFAWFLVWVDPPDWQMLKNLTVMVEKTVFLGFMEANCYTAFDMVLFCLMWVVQ